MRSLKMTTPRVHALGAALREARIEQRFSVRELGRQVGVDPALLSNWELGQRVPTPEEVAGVLGGLGIVGERKAWIMSLARGVAGPGWLTLGSQADPKHYTTLVAHERMALSATVWAPLLVPDLLQIPDYARLAVGPDLREHDELDEVVTKRLDRNRILFGAGAIDTEIFVGTAALGDHFGDAEMMMRQVRYLADVLGVSQSIRIRVARSEAVREGAFTVYRLRDMSEMVYCPHDRAGMFLVDEQAAAYGETIERLEAAALSVEDTQRRLSAIVHRYTGEVAAQRRAADAGLAKILTGE